MNLQIPQFLPDGSSIVMDSDFLDRLHNGDASVGWTGDPALAVYKGPDSRIELWRWCEDGEPRLIVRSRPGLNVLDTGVLKFLADHDSRSRRAFDIKTDIDAHNEKVRRDLESKREDSMSEGADRLYTALKKDIGHLEGGTTKDYL